ncbi:hypothetical protein PR048_008596, partial [Dryococelus australis]
MVHSLQLVVNSGCLKQRSVANVTGTCRRIVGHFHHSVLAKKSLVKTQKDLNVPSTASFRMSQPDGTAHTCCLKDFVNRDLVSLSTYATEWELTNQDWELADILVKIVKLFWEATKPLSGEQSTVAVCIPLVNSIKTEQIVKMFANELLTEMNHRFSDLERSMPHAMATPRYKDKVFLDEMHKKEAIQFLKMEVTTETEVDDNDQRSVRVLDNTGRSELFGFMSHIIQKDSNSGRATAQPDVGAEPLLSHDLSPFHYWKHCAHLPVLRSVAKKYFDIPPGSVYSERTFSISGLI